MNPARSQAFNSSAASKALLLSSLRSFFDAGAQLLEPGVIAWSPEMPSGTLTGLTALAEGAQGYEEATGIPAVVGLTHEALFCSAQRVHQDGDGNIRIETPAWLPPHLTGWLESIEPGWSLGQSLAVFQRRCADVLLAGHGPQAGVGETARSLVARWRALLCSVLANETQDAATWAALRQACARSGELPPFDQAVVTLIETVAWPDDAGGDEWLRGWASFLADAARAGLEADLEPELAALYAASQAAWRELFARAEREPDFDPYRHADEQPAIAAADDPEVARRLDDAALRRAKPLVEALFEALVGSLRETQALAPQPVRAADVSAEGGGLIDLQAGRFEAEVLQAQGLVLVDFWAAWCAPCKQFMPTLGALQRQFGDRVKFVKVDVDEHDALANQLGIRALPTLMLYRDGLCVDRVNVLTRARVEALLQERLA